MLLVIAGMRRSGSTLAYQLGCAIAGNKSGLRKISEVPKGVENRQDWYVIKTHRYLPETLPEIESGKVQVIITIRDPRDIATSIMSLKEQPFDMALSKVAWEIEQYRFWLGNCKGLHILRYEDFYNNLEVLIRKISGAIGMELDQSKIDELSERFSFENNMARSKEIVKTEADYMFPGHIQDGIVGKWRVWLTDEQIEQTYECIGSKWFEDNRYRLGQ